MRVVIHRYEAARTFAECSPFRLPSRVGIVSPFSGIGVEAPSAFLPVESPFEEEDVFRPGLPEVR